MKNISFDNPYLMLVAIPLFILLVVPYFIAIRKENKSKSTIISLILHTVIAIVVAVALSGMKHTTIMTETEVYVVADVSYSSNRNLDKIDEYIEELNGNLPENSKLGIVCFGKDYQLLTELGAPIASVKGAKVDSSATNISEALEYTSNLFRADTIKRIILISDGKQTDVENSGALIQAVNNLDAKNIYVDAIYLDNNIKEGEKEVQINDVEFTPSTYINHESVIDILIQSNTDNRAFVYLYDKDGKVKAEKTVPLTVGYNVVNLELDTTEGGTFDYRIEVVADDDTTLENNEYRFTQSVSETLNVLLVSKTKGDLEHAQSLYGESANIYAPLLLKKKEPVPYSIEELCKYDEIILSSMDVRDITNNSAFVENLDKAVSLFGKSLITIGDTSIQNKDDEILKNLENMLPIKYGNTDKEPKLYALVIDTSRSMENAERILIAKQSAIQILNMLSPTDYVTVISFAGEVTVIQRPIEVRYKDTVVEKINSIKPTQGTCIGSGLRVAYEQMKDQDFYEKYVMLISDGMSYTLEPDDPVGYARILKKAGIFTSTINTNMADGVGKLQEIATAGGGKAFKVISLENLKEQISDKISDAITETVIDTGNIPVNIEIKTDPSVRGLSSFPDIEAYIFGKTKSKATTVLTVDYYKNENDAVSVPLYSYWNYGNGKVTSISTAFQGDWVAKWTEGTTAESFQKRLLQINTPKQKVDYPYTTEVSFDGNYALLELFPVEFNASATVTVAVTTPKGEVIEATMLRDISHYYYRLKTAELGQYKLQVTYSYADKSYISNSSFDIPYAPEYDGFTIFEASVLHSAIDNYGTVSEDGKLSLKNDESEIATYVVSFTVPLMITAVALYVIDIIIRKLKWVDIKSFFKKQRKEEKKV